MTLTRDEKIAEARRLRGEGWSNAAIGRALGVDRRRIFDWLNATPCVSCGAVLSDSRNGRCVRCAADERTIWTRPAIIEAIQEWAALHGEPPAGPDWNPTHARYLSDEARARRFESDGCWPWHNTVVVAFGSWNAAIAVAGFTPRARHGGDGNEQRRRYMRAKATT